MHLLGKVLGILGRMILFGSLLLALMVPPLELFSPYLLRLTFKGLGLAHALTGVQIFFLFPLGLLLLGLGLWVTLESLSQKLLR
ncbi:MAG: hypothetical protein KC422_05210 [Trueperaceae bacterium]|nr:hypothetical protein [Trueperaceae bacterium]